MKKEVNGLKQKYKVYNNRSGRTGSGLTKEDQAIAIENGIPYQTFMSSILHRYVTGRLIDRNRPTKLFESDG